MTKELLQQALDALLDSVDLVANDYADAVELYSQYPSRQARLDSLKNDLDAHKAAIAALEAAIALPVQPAMNYTYASTQQTNCAGCGLLKHTPLRVDKMEGYVCLTCIDKKLESLLDSSMAAEPVAWRKANSDGFYRYYEADEDQPGLCEPLYAAIALPVQPTAQPVMAGDAQMPPLQVVAWLRSSCISNQITGVFLTKDTELRTERLDPLCKISDALAYAAQRCAVEPTAQPDDIHSCSFFCDLPGCIKIQRDLLRDTLTKDAP